VGVKGWQHVTLSIQRKAHHMSILVVGSVAYDTVITPSGKREDSLGGSATYFAIAGGKFCQVHIVAVVGQDFKDDHIALLRRHQLDVTGLKRQPGRTFRWAGEYHKEDVNSRTTLDTQLNVFADFVPQLSSHHRRQPYLFLANIAPLLQLQVLEQMEDRPRLVAADTMNFWIDGKRDVLTEVIKRVDVIFMDENEVRMFAGPHIESVNVVRSARYILSLGPRMVVVKRGEHGVVQFTRESVFAAPSYPLDWVVDPTGAGDSFAGGFMGYLASTGDLTDGGFRRATVLGSVMGSFAVENFSVERLDTLTRAELTARFRDFTRLSQFAALGESEALPWREGVIFG
jgi:sugar/nucleoside kinase (ribokinase family)